jgi:PAS domain S-box-containing protein
VSIFEDFTDKFQAEQKLQANLNFLQTLINAIPNPVFYKDTNGTYLGCNKACEESWGRPQEEVIGKSVFDFHPQDLAEIYHGMDMKLFSHPGVQVYETSMSHADGSRKDVVLHKATFSDLNGKLAGLIGVEVDISERKRAEEVLRQSEEKFRTLHEMSPIGIVLNRLDTGQFLESNKALWDMIGYNEEEIKKLSYWDITPIEYKEIESKQLELLNTVGRYGPYEKEYIHKDGTRFPVLLSGIRLKDPDGNNLIYSVIKDNTYIKPKHTALQESEEKYRIILRTAMDGFWRVDSQGRLLEVNEAYCLMSGYTEQELLNMGVADLEAAETPAETAIHLQKVIMQGEDRFETVHRRKDGSVFEVEVSVQYNPMERGRVAAFLRDITMRKRVEERLRESERRFRETLTNLNLIALQLDTQGNITFANDYLLKITGWDRSEIINKNWMDSFIPEEIRENIRELHKQNCREKNVQTDYINEICVKDGSRLLISWNNSRLLTEDGEVMGITSIGQDITEKNRIEKALQQSEARFRELVDNMSSAVAVYRAIEDGDDFVFQEVNSALERIEQVREEDLLGHKVTEVFPGVKEFGLFAVLQRVLNTGVPERFPMGLYQDQRISGWRDNYVYKLPSGEVVAVYDDVTARKHAEEQILASLKEKEALLKEIHHRVKNNMQIISALLTMQMKHDKDKTPAEMFRDCRNRIRSMALIHESLYSAGNLADINMRFYLQKLTNKLLAANASHTNRIRTKVTGSDVMLDISHAVPCGLIANELIVNSLKHAFKGKQEGEIQVSIEESGDQRVLEVRDNGFGLGPDFDQEPPSTFGWIIVKNLAKQLGGDFTVESNGGTRCRIVF